jgi:hypothetical protein
VGNFPLISLATSFLLLLVLYSFLSLVVVLGRHIMTKHLRKQLREELFCSQFQRVPSLVAGRAWWSTAAHIMVARKQKECLS